MTWWKPTFTKLWYLTCCACMHEWSVFTFCTPCHFPSSQMSNSRHKTSYFILFINQHPLSTRCMSKDGSEIKTRIKIPKEKKTTNQSPTLANWSKTESGQRENLQENVKTSLTKESAGNASCVPTTSWRDWTKPMEMSWNKIKWFGWYGCSWSEEGGDTMPSALKCLIEWVFFNPENLFLFQIVFHFSLLIIFHASNFTCITMDFMLYNDASDVEVMFDIYGNVQCTIIYLYQASIGWYNIGIIYCLDP